MIERRTQGIVIKAHDSVLHGHVSLVLKDAVTGKIKFEERGHNIEL